MASTMRRWNLLLIGATAVVLAACAKPAVVECGATGVLCPAGTHCAAAQGICLPDTNTCGDAHVDPGEICDDGNTVDGDRCSANCQSDESCGNDIMDASAGEVCDDGNTISGDDCSADCRSDESCGNMIIDTAVGEACDDGNHDSGDTCSADCRSDERCGNGFTDRAVGEVCDPPTDGVCGFDCRSLLKCGNAIIDPGEECDEGQDLNGDDKDCRADCVINRCGDGFTNLNGIHNHEDCDAAPMAPTNERRAVPIETAACNIDCKAPRCGDGVVNRSFTPLGAAGPEQCDNAANNNNNADCTATCQVSVCGDNLTNTAGPFRGEGCDDGDRDDNNDCTNACRGRSCGDGILATTPGNNEQCDLGDDNADNGACLENCRIAVCGDGKTRSGVEECDGGASCSASCRLKVCGNGIIDPGEECDAGRDGNNQPLNGNDKDCRSDCIVNRCGDGHWNEFGTHHEACDGAPTVPSRSTVVTPTETASCDIDCTRPACGDTIVNNQFTPMGATGPEQCDDGGIASGDNCSATCEFERCGNHVLDPGEQCDGPAGTGPCSSTCRRQFCGNGILDPTEECDNGNANNDNADCRIDCVINRCGDGNINSLSAVHPEQCDGGPVAHDRDRRATPTDVANCNSNCTDARCGDRIVNREFKPTATTSEQCDNDLAAGSPLAGDGCSATCQLETCGNGVTDANEQCDDGDRDQGDACENDCTLPRCGNGITDTGEQCDAGAANSDTGACTRSCRTATCGDGFVQAGEVCDDGNNDACGSCTSPSGNSAGNKCQRINSAAGTGVLIAVDGDQLIPSVDQFTLDDGARSRVFTFVNTNTPSLGQVGYDPRDDDAADVAGHILDALDDSGLEFTAHKFGSLLLLVNNRATENAGTISEAVNNDGFSVQGISGGAGGNCGSGIGCRVNNDCTPDLVCTNGSCATP